MTNSHALQPSKADNDDVYCLNPFHQWGFCNMLAAVALAHYI